MPNHNTTPTPPSLPTTPAASPLLPISHADGTTKRPETPALEGREPLPAELTGRASGTNDDLVSLFDDSSSEHLTDGFRGGSQDDPDSGTIPHSDEETIEEKQPE